jgi:hypothetical protein
MGTPLKNPGLEGSEKEGTVGELWLAPPAIRLLNPFGGGGPQAHGNSLEKPRDNWFFILIGGRKEADRRSAADREVRPTSAKPMGTPFEHRIKLAL